MGYKVKFDDGQEVEFDSLPGQEDIDEVWSQLSNKGPKSLTDLKNDVVGSIDTNNKLVGAGEIALNVGSQIGAIPLGIIGGSLQSVNEALTGQGMDQKKWGENMERIADRLTYKPQSEAAEDMMKPLHSEACS
jgi:hypothetical protein